MSAPAANNGGRPLYSPGVVVPVPRNGSSAKFKQDATAENGTAHTGQRTASVCKSRALQPPAPTPREPLVLQAASVSFERLDAHAKTVSRQTMSTKTELLQLLFNPQVVRSDLDKVRCVSTVHYTTIQYLFVHYSPFLIQMVLFVFVHSYLFVISVLHFALSRGLFSFGCAAWITKESVSQNSIR